MTPRTLFDKIWDAHVVAQDDSGPALLYVDLHLVHEVTSPQAFDGLRVAGRKVREASRTMNAHLVRASNPTPRSHPQKRVPPH